MKKLSERRKAMPKHLPNISVEKYAAYLDGNLPDEEMRQIDAFIENDSDMKAFVEADHIIDENNDMDWIDDHLQPFDMLSAIELPNIDSDLAIENNNNLLDVSDRIEDEIESITNDNNRIDFPDGQYDMSDNLDNEGMIETDALSNQNPYDFNMGTMEQPGFDESLFFDQNGFMDDWF